MRGEKTSVSKCTHADAMRLGKIWPTGAGETASFISRPSNHQFSLWRRWQGTGESLVINSCFCTYPGVWWFFALYINLSANMNLLIYLTDGKCEIEDDKILTRYIMKIISSLTSSHAENKYKGLYSHRSIQFYLWNQRSVIDDRWHTDIWQHKTLLLSISQSLN